MQQRDIVPLLGARRGDQLREVLGALEVHLTAEDLTRLEQAVPRGLRLASAIRRRR